MTMPFTPDLKAYSVFFLDHAMAEKEHTFLVTWKLLGLWFKMNFTANKSHLAAWVCSPTSVSQ